MRIYNLNQNDLCKESNTSEILGDRGCFLNQLASLELPISPACVFDAEAFKSLAEKDFISKITPGIKVIEKITNKTYASPDNSLLLKIVLSPSLKLSTQHSVHNLGLNDEVIEGFVTKTTEEFAYQEYRYLIINFLTNFTEKQKISAAEIEEINKMPSKEGCKSLLSKYSADFPMDVYEQLKQVFLSLRKTYYADKLNTDIPCALVVQAMMFGNYIGDSMSGVISTRDTITGEKIIRGSFVKNAFDISPIDAQPISDIDAKYLTEIEKASDKLEQQFKEIRRVKFVVEEAKFWLIDQSTETEKSVSAGLKILLDLHHAKTITTEYLLKQVSYGEIAILLHPEINQNSAKKMKFVDVGEIGSAGAATGKVYFSSAKLMQAYRDAKVRGEDTNVILCMPATYAGDVQAIEIGNGVICSEGGYASHAPVVARSLGKAAVLYKDLEIKEDSAVIDGNVVKEGDYISFSVPSFESPRIYFGKADLIVSDPKENGLLELMEIVSDEINKIKKEKNLDIAILANADTPKDTEVSLKFGAEGIGLCRTEHMFFAQDRVDYFRLLLVSEDSELRAQVLEKLKEFQKEDFRKLLKILNGKVLTVRLLDAPLHEFIPVKQNEIDNVKALLKEYKVEGKVNIDSGFERLKETNPMLGHRGCRFGISYPEIYQMQEAALFEAAVELCSDSKDKTPVKLKIMFPLISFPEEFKFLLNGRDIEGTVIPGLKGIAKEVLNKYSLQEMPFEYEVGVMVEVPAAALLASDLAKYASFFSFGTNDLTQTTHGISRDDINSFYSSYTQYDVISENPFMFLSEPVKDLILHAISSGKIVRPDLSVSLCGEQGSEPKDIEFCLKSKFNSISCSPFKVPLAKFSIAKYFIK